CAPRTLAFKKVLAAAIAFGMVQSPSELGRWIDDEACPNLSRDFPRDNSELTFIRMTQRISARNPTDQPSCPYRVQI
ncbi:MAG: hypothetical protein O2890_09860, partial [Cyanobacteria bacterium]|nr:hypothetical protein [Cyanobacteriota bacterium]